MNGINMSSSVSWCAHTLPKLAHEFQVPIAHLTLSSSRQLELRPSSALPSSLNQRPPELETFHLFTLGKKILSLSQLETQKLGIGKSTLHYLRDKANSSRLFRARSKIREKLEPRAV